MLAEFFLEFAAEVPVHYGRLIAAARRTQGWNQTELAKQVGESRSTISRWEREAGGPPNVKQAARLASKLGIKSEQLLEAIGGPYAGLPLEARLEDELIAYLNELRPEELRTLTRIAHGLLLDRQSREREP